ncbi:MAG: hypothetical protein QT05_C0052G0042 [archaeon GW2011_AR13]|nr:MAG: hypothetical protein QT05_C0052G0042 [archaeon GW2011_AR13]HIG94273.1 hypothetical protein [Nanoarchaeota archaeon]HIH63172.1 hypothetical protein [Nanoarchaeota archaeon]HIJ09211.1 hypothetical protein [Nanoarchaeota archaeon]
MITYNDIYEAAKRHPLVPFEPPRSFEGWHLYEPLWMPQCSFTWSILR